MISWQDLAQRCILWEEYLKTYPESLVKTDARELYRIYVSAFLSGTSNTRLCWNYADWKDSPQQKEIHAAFEWLISEYPQNNISELAKAYLPILEKAGWSYTPSIDTFLEEHDIKPGYASRRMIQ